MKRKLVGALATARQDRLSARALTLSDLKSFTRTCYLASVINTGVYRRLENQPNRADLAASIGVVHNERFDAWVNLGLSLKELGERKNRLSARGRRLKAIMTEDADILGSYRTAVQLEAPMYDNIIPLLTAAEDHDPHWAQTRSYTSLLAKAAVVPTIKEAATEAPNARFLEVGCHDGSFTASILRARPAMTGIAIDVDSQLLALTKQRLNNRGLGNRVETRLADPDSIDSGSFGLITLVNQISQVPSQDREQYLRHIVELLEPGGFLVIVSLVAGGTAAAASIDFSLRTQKDGGGLPTLREIDQLLETCELGVSHREQVLPSESLYAITAYRGWF